jgi:hypothetical protein
MPDLRNHSCYILEADVDTPKIEFDEHYPPNAALKKFQENQRVKNVRLIVTEDCCPVCAAYEGTYDKHEAPPLPIEGCSHSKGCRCFYEPMLTTIYP